MQQNLKRNCFVLVLFFKKKNLLDLKFLRQWLLIDDLFEKVFKINMNYSIK